MDGIACAFVGRVGQDPDERFTTQGTPLLRLSVAVQDSKAADGAAEWVRVAVFGDRAAELRERITRGTELYVEGRLKLSRWQGADGTPRSGLEVSAWKVEPLGQIGRRRPATTQEPPARAERPRPLPAASEQQRQLRSEHARRVLFDDDDGPAAA